MNLPNPYTLPTIDFVSGSTQDFLFHCYFFHNKEAHDLSSCTANFSVVHFVNKRGTPLLSKPMVIGTDASTGGRTHNVLSVTLTPSDTIDLPAGKYIYQISIRDIKGNIEIPNQGIMYIIENINKPFAR